ncbi:MAG: hypothetical protein SFU99_12135 [Saprospiraceae bacterium]|nr:hypothetical protein [Saprospiraceae bacterium]
MTFAEFRSLAHPQDLPPLLQALWQDAQGNWHKAHEIAQDIETPDGAWVHAYLHRKEGDIWNADYWYRRAGRTRPDATLEKEWEEIVKGLL